MAVPKRRCTSTRRDKRRSHDAIRAFAPSTCPNCKQAKMAHRVCPTCGHYGGAEVIQMDN